VIVLGLETSCDETAAAVVDGAGRVRSNVVASQAALHARYGGVVPEVASRRHLELAMPVVTAALDEAGVGLAELDAVAVTEGPGLIGALLVGLATAKAIAYSHGLPLVPVDHLHGHAASLYLEPDPFEPPFLLLLASGGHTMLAEVESRSGYRPIGQTLDDAAGEAFDKGARLLGLPYPGGPELERLAAGGDPASYSFPVSMVGRPGHDFSFSGLKTALRYAIEAEADGGAERRADLAASYQAAIVASLVRRTMEAVRAAGHTRLGVVGGVARNGVLRAALEDACRAEGVELALAPPALCADNAAMIASAARYLPAIPAPDYLMRDAFASLPA
jgi:N6-L-threonylcarbamoyladenine synthase